MEFKAKTRTEGILMVMNILAWLAFVGFMIKAGAIVTSYAVSCFNPEATKNLYLKLDLHELRDYSFWHYTTAVSFMVALLAMKAYVSWLSIKTLSSVNLKNPFTVDMVTILEKISYVLLGTWVITMLYNAHAVWLLKHTGVKIAEYESGEFIFIAGLVFIISQVFKRGVEIQSENDLTV